MATLQESADTSSHRACAHCRSQKVRCIPDQSDPDVCQRCVRSGRTCIFTPLQKRKQRKRTDTRVAELEREMRTMRALLHNKNKGTMPAPAANAEAGAAFGVRHEENVANATLEDSARGSIRGNGVQNGQIAQASAPGSRISRSPADYGRDVVDRNIISMATARQLFETYRRDLFPQYPMVVIPDDVAAEDMRRSKPVLFLAIISAASSKDCPDLSLTLDQEVLQVYAARSLVQSEKSLELIQALLISAVWYHPPSKFGQLKYYEYIHMAATMAMDLGIGTRPVPHRSRFGASSRTIIGGHAPVHHLEDAKNPDLSLTPRSRGSSPEVGSLESRRTFVSCYSICTGVAVSLRRPNMLRVTAHLRECVEYIEQSPKALPSDRRLVVWVKLMMIADEISNSFQYEDPGSIASITELRTQLMLKDYAKRLDDFWASVPESDINGSLTIIYWTARLYLHEVALHVDHSPDDFKAPYQMGVIHAWEGDDVPTQVLAEAVAECILSARNLLSAFNAMEVESSRGLPVLAYVRVSFAAFILAKLCLSASSPDSQIGRVLDRSSLNAEESLDEAILHVRAVAGPTTCRVPAIFLALLFKLRQWCLNPKLIEPPEESILQTGMAAAETKGKLDNVFEGSRAIEQSSDEDSSLPSAQEGAYESMAAVSITETSNQTSESPNPNIQVAGNPVAAPSSNADVRPLDPPVSAFLNPNDEMQLDTDFFDFFQDVDALETDDMWASIPTDLLGLADDFNWQSQSDEIKMS